MLIRNIKLVAYNTVVVKYKFNRGLSKAFSVYSVIVKFQSYTVLDVLKIAVIHYEITLQHVDRSSCRRNPCESTEEHFI